MMALPQDILGGCRFIAPTGYVFYRILFHHWMSAMTLYAELPTAVQNLSGACSRA